ncbi:MAG: hypothetical protein AAGI69_16865 [Cyanobacteria bacterium P01_H01_bin.21]
MQPALHITTTVLPDNRIEIDLPSGTAGQQVTVFIVLTDNPEATISQPPQQAADKLEKTATDLNIQARLTTLNPISTAPEKPRSAVSEILARIRSRPRVDPLEFDLPDSTDLIREDRER